MVECGCGYYFVGDMCFKCNVMCGSCEVMLDNCMLCDFFRFKKNLGCVIDCVFLCKLIIIL